MTFRAILLGTSLLYAAPAIAAIDPPAASQNDGRIRSVVYDPNNPVELYTVPGASQRIELGGDETVVQIVVSDQDTIAPDPLAPPPAPASANPFGQGGSATQPSCDPNMCRTVAGNIVYIKPIRALDPQPLFIQTQRLNAFGKQEMVTYTFELLTKPNAPDKDIKTASLDAGGKTDASVARPNKPLPPVWGVRFIYPERAKQQAAADWRQKQAAWAVRARETDALAHPVIDTPGKDANFKYAWRGSASFKPDRVWDDGRSTYLRYDGNSRVPNVYSLLPSGEPTIPATWPQPDANGTTLKIAGTESKWYVADGGVTDVPVGCVLNLGPDPEGRTSTTVAER